MDKKPAELKNAGVSPVSELKAFIALQALNIYELNRFKKFLHSPYFNVNDQIRNLFAAWEPVLRGETDQVPMRSESWSSSTSGKEYNDLKFRKLCSDLLKLFERFLAQEAFEKNPLHRADYLMQSVYEKRLEPLYKSAMRTAQRLSDQTYLRPAFHFFYKYSYEKWLYSLSGLEIDRSRPINVEEIAQNLDLFYVAEKLRYFCYVLTSKTISTAHEYDLLFMDEIIALVEAEGYNDIVPINFYYQIYLTQKEPGNPAHYEKLRSLINESILLVPEAEGKEIIDATLNYCIQRINEGKSEYLREVHNLYREALDNELIFVNEKITAWTFRNMIVTGLRLGEYDWVESFIARYQQRLDEKYRDNAVSFNSANLYFYKKEYDRVISLLQEVEYEDPSYNLNSKTMLLLTYYELDEIEALISLVSSFSTFLRRSKDITSQRKSHYLSLIKFVRGLVRVQTASEAEILKLRKQIETTEGVVNKSWLLEKIDELLPDS